MDEQRRSELDAYYTPEGIAIDMAMILNPRPGSRILDPMCGNGMLLRTLRDMYPDRDLKFTGMDIDIEAISECKKWARQFDTFFDRDIQDIKYGERYACNLIIMNPCFHYGPRFRAMEYAFQTFDKGIMYVPFKADNPMINLLECDRFEMQAYDKDYLEGVFDCEIKYRQGYIYWEKAK